MFHCRLPTDKQRGAYYRGWDDTAGVPITKGPTHIEGSITRCYASVRPSAQQWFTTQKRTVVYKIKTWPLKRSQFTRQRRQASDRMVCGSRTESQVRIQFTVPRNLPT